MHSVSTRKISHVTSGELMRFVSRRNASRSSRVFAASAQPPAAASRASAASARASEAASCAASASRSSPRRNRSTKASASAEPRARSATLWRNFWSAASRAASPSADAARPTSAVPVAARDVRRRGFRVGGASAAARGSFGRRARTGEGHAVHGAEGLGLGVEGRQRVVAHGRAPRRGTFVDPHDVGRRFARLELVRARDAHGVGRRGVTGQRWHCDQGRRCVGFSQLPHERRASGSITRDDVDVQIARFGRG